MDYFTSIDEKLDLLEKKIQILIDEKFNSQRLDGELINLEDRISKLKDENK